MTWLRHADSFGAAGFLTVAPDLFNGHPSPTDLDAPGFNQTKFLEEHGPETTDPLIAKGIRYLKEQKGVDKVVVRTTIPFFLFPFGFSAGAPLSSPGKLACPLGLCFLFPSSPTATNG